MRRDADGSALGQARRGAMNRRGADVGKGRTDNLQYLRVGGVSGQLERLLDSVAILGLALFNGRFRHGITSFTNPVYIDCLLM